MRPTAGMATDRGVWTGGLGQVSCLRSVVGCCGDVFWVQEAKGMGQRGSEVGAW